MLSGDLSPVSVDLGPRSYGILVGPGAIGEAGRRHVSLRLGPAFVVTDSNVAGLHGEALTKALEAADVPCRRLEVPAGERGKTLEAFGALAEDLLVAGITRGGCVYALGGGAVGDLAGFAAASVLRGVDFVQVPTTLLAQVDSSVGGKTGINAAGGKNLIGAFHQPRFVLADTRALATLPEREFRAGYAEVVKYALLGDAPFFDWLERNRRRIFDGDEGARAEAVRHCCAMKARVTAADERERGERALLNLGHTFGHALEAEAGLDGSLLHGEAVAVGLVLAFRLSARLGLAAAGDAERVAEHLGAAGLPVTPRGALGKAWKGKAALARMRGDKKVGNDGRIVLVLARGIGSAFLAPDVDERELAAFLDEAGAS